MSATLPPIVEVAIRPAHAGDRDVLIAFHHALYAVHRVKMVPPEEYALSAYQDLPTVLRHDVDAILRRPTSLALLAEFQPNQGTPEALGYITGRWEDEPRRVFAKRGIVEDWFVEPPARGQGVGRKLFEAMLDAFRRAHCAVVESTTWPGNALATHAHRELGFIAVETKFRMRLEAPGADPE